MADAANRLEKALLRLAKLKNLERELRRPEDFGLLAIRDLLAMLGNPERKFRSIHVTGTKGKGSICSLLEAALAKAGLSVGRYSTPYLWHPREQISLSMQPISDSLFAEVINDVMDCVDGASGSSRPASEATYFDVVTSSAYLAFARKKLDWAVIEVGMGGRWDSTNAIDSEVAVITNVDLEHTKVLGKTRSEIALNKVGIVKSGSVLVSGLSKDDPVEQVVAEQARAVGARIVHAVADAGTTIAGRNCHLAGRVLDCLGSMGVRAEGPPEGRLIGDWLLTAKVQEAAKLPGRLEHFRLAVTTAGGVARISVILDGAHVASSLRAVISDLNREGLAPSQCIAVVGLASDKNKRAFLSELRGHSDEVIVTNAPTPSKAFSASQLAKVAHDLNLTVREERDPARALETALVAASEKAGWVFVTGSLHLVGALRCRCLPD